VGVCAGYPERAVLHSVDAAIAPGEITAIVGPNGAGKSTLLRVLLGLITPTRGEVLLDGARVHAMPARARAARMAYVAQRPSLAFATSVLESVAMGCALAHARHARDRALDALSRVGLADRAHEDFATLSAGQQQRVALARALAQVRGVQSGAILADEPVSAMDPAHALASMRLLREAASAGARVGVVLHDLSLAQRSSDRVLVLDASGAVRASGPTRDVLTPGVLRETFGVEFESLHGARASALAALDP
jgi:iron complex transport system ATP-binding protein